MYTPAAAPDAASAGGDAAIFGNVVVGIDETPESLVAAAQAAALRPPGGRLALVAVSESHFAAWAGLAAPHAEDTLAAGRATILEQARELVDADDAVLASGSLVDHLCSECGRRGATLIAVGVRPHRRLSALTFGGHDVDALHGVRCPLLIARPGWGPAKPERIVVPVDGSAEARAAEVVARSLAERLGCPIVPVVPLGEHVDAAVLRAEREDALLDPGGVVEAVAGASTRGSLVVLGRGPHGRHRWGGDLVERVVYSARCSVLVVQGADPAAA